MITYLGCKRCYEQIHYSIYAGYNGYCEKCFHMKDKTPIVTKDREIVEEGEE